MNLFIGRNFNTKVALSDHERSDCGKAPIYQCHYCEKNYHSAGSLKFHLTIHTNSLEFHCNFCKKQFRTKGQLKVHERSHTKEKNYKCSHCPAEFGHRESLLTHNSKFSCLHLILRYFYRFYSQLCILASKDLNAALAEKVSLAFPTFWPTVKAIKTLAATHKSTKLRTLKTASECVDQK